MESNAATTRGRSGESLAVLLVVAMLIEVVVIVVLPRDVVDRAQLNHLCFHVPLVLAIIACIDRSRVRPMESRAWRTMALALGCFTAGSLYSVYLLEGYDPSPADALFLSFYVLLGLAIVLLARARLTRVSALTWLDGAVGGVGAGAVVSAIVFRHYPDASNTTWVANFTNLSYPSADVMLIVLLMLVGRAVGLRDRLWWLLAGGLLVFLAGDVVFLYRVSINAWPAITPFEMAWPAGVTLIGLAASVTGSPRAIVSRAIRHFVPVIFVAMTVCLLVIGQREQLPAVSIVLSVIAVVLGAIRMAVAQRGSNPDWNDLEHIRVDYLTKLPNRRALSDGLAAAMEADHVPTALLVIDLDSFKEVNDSLGHVAGDRLLRRVGKRLSEAVPVGALLARLGGDEFGVVLPGFDASQASDVAHELRAAMKPPFILSGLRVPVQASVGVAAAPVHGLTSVDVLSAADIAMYQAKRQGNGVAVFRVETGDPSRDRLRLITDLPTAMTRGEFCLFFQPQWSTTEERITGLEALVRWRHPVHGLINPDRFLPLITKRGLMPDLTDIVAAQAVEAWSRLRGLGHRLRMSVNVSASDLTGGRLVDTMERLRRVFDVSDGSMVVEVTEDAVIVDHEQSVLTLAALRDAGVIISIDDYGTGQASLAYLRDLPLDELKIDRSFLSGVPADTHNSAIVRSTIELAHTLRLPVVAEGVETAEVMTWLSELGCDGCQGYHIARPMPYDDLVAWLEGAGGSVAV